MKTKISAFVDGELEAGELAGVIEALERDDGSREAWCVYHLISDAVRDTALRSAGFSARVADKLAAEPTVLAPGRLPAERARWIALSAAASVAAVALVGWLAFAPGPPELRPGMPQSAPLASGPLPGSVQPASIPAIQPVARQAVAVQRESVVPPAHPVAAQMTDDYLFAHQEFSPRMSLQGMVPYVRTVSGPVTQGPRR
jgi:sigma-E factor negative regulatory protein RseA